MQAYESLVIVVSKALGGSEDTADTADTAEPDEAAAPKTAEELEARLARAFRNG